MSKLVEVVLASGVVFAILIGCISIAILPGLILGNLFGIFGALVGVVLSISVFIGIGIANDG